MTTRAPNGGPVPRPGILDIEPYKGGQAKDDTYWGKLSANESALGTSPAALKAYGGAGETLHRYPDGGAVRLREAIARIYGLEADRIVCGFGSDEILQLMCRAYAGPGDEVIHTEHGFLVYPIAALSAGAVPVGVPDDGYHASVDNILAAVNERTRLVFLANPNNPTGTYVSAADVERLHAGLPQHVVLVLDAAYAEYVEEADYDPGVSLAKNAPNVLMTRTFSKIYGLAALRLGWAYGPEAIIDVLNRLRGPFNVSGPAQAAGLAALEDQDFIARQREHVRRWRDVFAQRLGSLGLGVVPSAANFVLIRFASPEAAASMDEALRGKGFYLRRMDRYGFPDHLRLTVGTEPENEGVMDAFAELTEPGGHDV